MIWIIFVMGVSNIFLHRSVMEGRGPVFAEVARALHRFAGGYGGYAIEFIFLVGALWFAKSGQSIILFFYGGYTALNIGTYMMLRQMNGR